MFFVLFFARFPERLEMAFASDIESYMRSLPDDLEIILRGWNDEGRIRTFMRRRTGEEYDISTDERPIPCTEKNIESASVSVCLV